MSLLTQHFSMAIRETKRWRLVRVLGRALERRRHLVRAPARIFARNNFVQRFLRSGQILSTISEQRFTNLTSITNINSPKQSTLFIILDHQQEINFAKQKVEFTRHAISRFHPIYMFLRVRLSSYYATIYLIIHLFHVQQH